MTLLSSHHLIFSKARRLLNNFSPVSWPHNQARGRYKVHLNALFQWHRRNLYYWTVWKGCCCQEKTTDWLEVILDLPTAQSAIQTTSIEENCNRKGQWCYEGEGSQMRCFLSWNDEYLETSVYKKEVSEGLKKEPFILPLIEENDTWLQEFDAGYTA